MSVMQIANFIGNEFISTPTQLPIINPANEQLIAHCAQSTAQALEDAISAASAAVAQWQATSQEQRAALLNQLADAIEENSEAFAQLESLNTGKPITLARHVDIARSIENFRFFAQAITQQQQSAFVSNSKGFNVALQRPLGIVGCISPWNLPLYLLTWKLAPALAMGNCVIAKPSEVTPLTANFLAELARDILPAGVLNIVHGQGNEIGHAICQHPQIKAISFTGGTATGKRIMQSCASNLKKISLELGGKNAAIVTADCDLKQTVKLLVRSSFSNQGQICLCTSRILVEEKVYDEFKHQFLKEVASLKIGLPQDESTQFSCLGSKQQFEKVLSYIRLAENERATILCGGKVWPNQSNCIEPTVIEGLQSDHRLLQEEIFGPVVCLLPFTDDKQAIELANNTDYGLASCVFSQNIARCHYFAEKLESGIVWINTWMMRDLRTPFGGSNASGIGREGGRYALEFFSETKNICFNHMSTT